MFGLDEAGSSGAATLPRLLRAAAERYAGRPAYVEGDRTLSFAELLDTVRTTAGGYRARGLEPGERVVVWAPNSIDWVVAALAVTYAGGTLVPVNSRYTGHEAADIVDRTGATLAVVADGFLGRSQIDDLRAASDLSSVREIIDLAQLHTITADPAGLDQVADDVTPDDVADILFTSGTTGRPKGAMSAHRQTIGVSAAWAALGGVTADDRYLVVNPFFHSFGYKIGIVVGLLTGATLYPMATFDVEETMRLIASERITLLPGAPTIYQSLLAAPNRGEFDLSSLRCPRRADREDAGPGARGARDRPRRDRVRDDRGGRGDHVPRGRPGRDRRHYLRPRGPGHGDPHRRTRRRGRRAPAARRPRDARLPRRPGGHRRGDRCRRLVAHR
jgi:acyl-CoA synthetase (AMP-forming)/AMP-acid ligase II